MHAPEYLSLVHGTASPKGDVAVLGEAAGAVAAGEVFPSAARARRPRRILLLRSGRHLRVAMDSLAARFPGCRIAVVGTPGSQPAIQQAGIPDDDVFFYGESRFQPGAFFFSRTAWAARRWRYDRVAILWNDPDGQGQGNVDRSALAMSPRGYLAVTPDGTIVERALWPQLRTEGLRLLASVAVGVVLAVFLYGPALVMKSVRQVLIWRPMKWRAATAIDGAMSDRRAGLYGPPEAPHEEAPYDRAIDGAMSTRRAGLYGPPDATPRSVVLPFRRPEAQR